MYFRNVLIINHTISLEKQVHGKEFYTVAAGIVSSIHVTFTSHQTIVTSFFF